MRKVLTGIFLLLTQYLFAQQVFTEEAFIAAVKQYHPIARSANIGVSIAKAELLSSRSGFDPVFKYNSAEKTFDGTRYYDDEITELKIPTWYGIDLYAGTENIKGSRINPEETKGSVSYLGVSVPILQNMVMDKRRAALKQARILVDQSAAARTSALNDLLRDGLNAYWTWWEQYNLYKLIDSSLKNAQQRLVLVTKAYQLGDRPAIDTVEALTQVQSFDVQKMDAYTKLVKAQLEVNAFLWTEDGEPYQLPENSTPQYESNTTQVLLDTLMASATVHPDLQQYRFKLSALQVDRQLKFQSLLPDVDLKYNQLGKGYNLLQTAKAPYFTNNYRFGIAVAVPLRLSYGRGEYQKAKLKIEQTTWDQQNKQVQIQTKVKQYYTEWQQTLNQLAVQNSAVNNYATLQRGEEIRFNNGESSLFLINSREQKTLESKQKRIELQAKNKRAYAAVQWAAGIIVQ